MNKGDTLRFYLSTAVDPHSIQVYKYGNQKTLIGTYPGVRGARRVLPDSSYWYGCGWPESSRLVIPGTWSPGLYVAEFPGSSQTKAVFFAVREAVPGSFSRVLLLENEATVQAYNNYGGKSLYDFNSTDRHRSAKVSYLRPAEGSRSLLTKTVA